MIQGGYLGRVLRQGILFNGMLKDLRASEFWTLEQFREYQNQQLRKVIAHAYKHVPYYTKTFKGLGLEPGDIQTMDDLPKLPLLTRQVLLEHQADLKSNIAPRLFLHEARTSGTTGSPRQFLRDYRSINYENATVWRLWNDAGVTPADRILVCRGVHVVPIEQAEPPFWIQNKAQNTLSLSAYHLKDSTLPAYLDAIEAFAPTALQAFPSTAYILARYLQQMGIKRPLKAVFTSSEPLYEHMRKLIEEVFCCKVFDFYGVGERVAAASECEAHDGLHICEEYGIVELLDEKGASADNHGEIIGTSLHNYAMPLIRYAVGDSATYQRQACSCGRHSRKIDFIQTRLVDEFRRPDGTPVAPLTLTRAFRVAPHVDQSQLIQKRLDHVLVKVKPRDSLFEAEEKEPLAQKLREVMGPGVTVEIILVEDIPRTANGKYRQLISEVEKS